MPWARMGPAAASPTLARWPFTTAPSARTERMEESLAEPGAGASSILSGALLTSIRARSAPIQLPAAQAQAALAAWPKEAALPARVAQCVRRTALLATTRRVVAVPRVSAAAAQARTAGWP